MRSLLGVSESAGSLSSALYTKRSSFDLYIQTYRSCTKDPQRSRPPFCDHIPIKSVPKSRGKVRKSPPRDPQHERTSLGVSVFDRLQRDAEVCLEILDEYCQLE